MLTHDDEIIRYDGQTLAVTTSPVVQVEARRGRRWGCFGRKGWWVHLYLLRGWHIRKFVLTLAETGIFLRYDASTLAWVERDQQHLASSSMQLPSSPCPWNSEAPLWML